MENDVKNGTSTKNIWMGIALIVVIAGIIILVVANNNSLVVEPAPTPVTENNTNALEPESTVDISITPLPTIPGAASISYVDALKTYATRRIQLDKTCQANPRTVTYKDNTGVMIDNRSPLARTVKIGTTFTIKPYGFKIVVLPDTYLKAKTILVDCDKSQNVATILVQE